MITCTKYVGGPPIEIPISIPALPNPILPDYKTECIECQIPDEFTVEQFIGWPEECLLNVPLEFRSQAKIDFQSDFENRPYFAIYWNRPLTPEDVEEYTRQRQAVIDAHKAELRRQYEIYKREFGDE